CADDYGLRDDIDLAILQLVGTRRLSAVSCMVALERCSQECLVELLKFQSKIDIGLHLCFTDEGLPLSHVSGAGKAEPQAFRSFSAALKAASMRRIEPQQATRQITLQHELFVEKCGRRPDFIDGHLHVHQLPGIREGLLNFVSSLPKD